jgi:5-methyltetrahydropteroyltriglutamate--homocysteine methyltransferase
MPASCELPRRAPWQRYLGILAAWELLPRAGVIPRLFVPPLSEALGALVTDRVAAFGSPDTEEIPPMAQPVLLTTVVGSYPQPDWLVDRALLSKGVPRVRLQAMWRVPEAFLEQAQDDATIVAIRDMERAGIDIVSDGEIRRESYSNRFATALEGVDVNHPALITDRYGNQTQVPRVVARVRRARPVELRDMQFLRRNTDRPAKITLPGPFTMAQQARNEFYRDVEELAMDLAAAVNMEAHELQAAGADVIQLDEPWLRNDPEGAKRYAVPAINRALAGLTVPTALHLCFGYAAVVKHQKPTGYSFLPQLAATTARQISIEAAQPRLDLGVLAELSGKSIILGVIDLGDPAVETPDQVTARIRAGLAHVPAERLILAPDCGMKYLSRETAFGKLCALTAGARAVRAQLA